MSCEIGVREHPHCNILLLPALITSAVAALWCHEMDDKQWALEAARGKRELAAFVRRIAATMSLEKDRSALLRQAAEIESEAEKLERDGRGQT